eukprot:442586-Pelagomonas_calceolata.AAC.2
MTHGGDSGKPWQRETGQARGQSDSMAKGRGGDSCQEVQLEAACANISDGCVAIVALVKEVAGTDKETTASKSQMKNVGGPMHSNYSTSLGAKIGNFGTPCRTQA